MLTSHSVTSAEAFASAAPACLARGIDVVAASVGALQDSALLERIVAICDETGSRLVVPAGAVGGLGRHAEVLDVGPKVDEAAAGGAVRLEVASE